MRPTSAVPMVPTLSDLLKAHGPLHKLKISKNSYASFNLFNSYKLAANAVTCILALLTYNVVQH